MRIDTSKITRWNVATKTKSLRAKPLANILVDSSLLNKFLVKALEGNETLKEGSIICLGETGDVWQQTSDKLLSKYNVTAISTDGWLTCTPKPDNEVNVVEITPEVLLPSSKLPFVLPPADDEMYKAHSFYIFGQWGEDVPGFGKTVQWGDRGDFVCQNRTDPTDVWIVKRKIFLNSYSIKNIA